MTRALALVAALLCAVQSTDLVAFLVPDDCAEISTPQAPDECSSRCARCVCCAQRPPSIVQPAIDLAPAAGVAARTPPCRNLSTTEAPRDVFHVPRPSASLL